MDANSIQFQALVTFLVPFALQAAKASQAKSLQWIDQAKPKVTVLTSALVALGTSVGITLTHASHSVTLTWVDLPTAIHGLVVFVLTVAVQIGGQHVAYESLVKYVMPVQSNIIPETHEAR